MRAVAVAAVGVLCGLGRDGASVTAGLRAHRSAARPMSIRGPGLFSRLAVEVEGDVPEPDGFPDDRKVALLADAVAQALIGCPDVAPGRRGVFLGTGLSSVTPRELDEDIYRWLKDDGTFDAYGLCLDLATDRVAPRRHCPDRAAALAAAIWGATGPRTTTFSACAAGAEAIAAGARAIARGDADVVLAGGHDSMVHPLGILSFEALGALAPGPGRPFDRRRDGFLIGEGAAVLRLEPLETCRTPLAIVMGAGSSLDAFGITAPHPDGKGAEASMRRALRDANVPPGRVGWVKAHATGTPVGDVAEAAAIRRMFGADVPVSSLKGAIGHTIAAAGAVETAASVLALQAGFVPGTVGCDEPENLGIAVLREPRDAPPGVIVANAFGFGGQNCSLVLGRA
jgi:3-oxoacyl-[acyl-carrier-protein] synthase II